MPLGAGLGDSGPDEDGDESTGHDGPAPHWFSPQSFSRCKRGGTLTNDGKKRKTRADTMRIHEPRPTDRPKTAVQVLDAHARGLLGHRRSGNRLLRALS